jgi:threonine/homoserine/homoserine lactone efflux protein
MAGWALSSAGNRGKSQRTANELFLGSVALLVLVHAGAGLAFAAEPRLRAVIALGGGVYVSWLGLRMMRPRAPAALCLLVWALLGAALSRALERPTTAIWFDRAMGAMLVASAIPLALEA